MSECSTAKENKCDITLRVAITQCDVCHTVWRGFSVEHTGGWVDTVPWIKGAFIKYLFWHEICLLVAPFLLQIVSDYSIEVFSLSIYCISVFIRY